MEKSLPFFYLVFFVCVCVSYSRGIERNRLFCLQHLMQMNKFGVFFCFFYLFLLSAFGALRQFVQNNLKLSMSIHQHGTTKTRQQTAMSGEIVSNNIFL